MPPWEKYVTPEAAPAAGPWSRYAAPAEAPATPARQPDNSVGGMLEGGKRAVESGLTFGLRDEAQAGIDAVVNAGISGVARLFGRERTAGPTGLADTYNESLARERGQSQQFQEDHPVASIAGNVVGGALVPGQMGAGFIRGSGVAAGLGRGAVAGGVGGAAAGFGEGEGGFGPRTQNALMGGAIGAGGGLALGAGVRAGSAVLGRAGHALGLRNPETAADRQVLRSLDRAGVTVDQAEAGLTAGGDAPLALVDVGGRNTVALGATAANTPSRAMDAADDFVQGRRIGRPDRLTNAGDAAFGGGSGDDVAAATAARQAQRATEAAPLYEEAFSRSAGFNEAMQGVLDDPVTRAGLARGLEIQRIENTARRARGEDVVSTTDPSIQYDDQGVPRIVAVPNMRSLDAVKRGLDAIIEDARDTTTGRIQWTERTRAIDDLRRTWVSMLDRGNPAYAEARAAWAGPSAQMEATAAGRTALRTDRDVVAQRMQNSPPDVQDAYRLGAGRDFSDRVSDPAKASGAARQMLEDGQMQARLNSLLSPEALTRLNTVLRRETDMTAVERAVSPRAGSQTGRLMAGADDMGRDPLGPWGTALTQITTGRPIAAAGTVLQDQWRRIGQGINPATADALANRLFTTDPAARGAVIQQLRNRLMQDAQTQERARLVGGRLLQGLGVGSALAND